MWGRAAGRRGAGRGPLYGEDGYPQPRRGRHGRRRRQLALRALAVREAGAGRVRHVGRGRRRRRICACQWLTQLNKNNIFINDSKTHGKLCTLFRFKKFKVDM